MTSNEKNINDPKMVNDQKITDDPNDRGKLYFEILKKATSNINWLFLTLIIFTGVNFFMLYRWHCGNIKFAIKREQTNIDKKNFDMFYQKVSKTAYFEKTAYFDSTDIIKKNYLKSEVNKRIKELNDLDLQGSYSTLPFLGIPFYITDYVVMLLMIGMILFYWLYRNLKFSRDVLKEYYNAPRKLDPIDSELISSLFYFIFPSGEKFKRYKQIELGLVFYVISISLILASNLIELFLRHSYYLSLIEQPGIWDFLPHIFVTTLIIISCFVLSIIIWKQSKRYLLDLRNLVILTKWEKRAFFPALYDLFHKNNRKLMKDKNLLEYRRPNDSDDLFLCITTVENKNLIHKTRGHINLPESLKKFYINHPKGNHEKDFDTTLERILTEEVQNMRDFFEIILTDYNYEKELCESWISETKIKNKVPHAANKG
jgi:hypothetical protein